MLQWLRSKLTRRRPAVAPAPVPRKRATVPPVPFVGRPMVTVDDVGELIPRRIVRVPDAGHVAALVDRVRRAAQTGAVELPAFPASSVRLVDLVESPTIDLNEVVRALHWEPAAVTEILRVASSVKLNRGTFDDLRSAVLALGTAEVGAIAVAVAARSLFEPESRATYDLFPGLWRSAHHEVLAVAFTASWLATARKLPRADRVFLRAIITQCGRMVALRVVAAEALAGRHPVALPTVIEAAIDELAPEVLEIALERWALPPSVTGVLDPSQIHERAIVELAMALAELRRAPYRIEVVERIRDRMNELELDASWLKVIMREHEDLTGRAAAMG